MLIQLHVVFILNFHVLALYIVTYDVLKDNYVHGIISLQIQLEHLSICI